MTKLTIVALALLATTTTSLAQGTGQPTNNLPNPYRTIANAFKLPDGREWGSTSAVEIDKDGRSIWVGGALRGEFVRRHRTCRRS